MGRYSHTKIETFGCKRRGQLKYIEELEPIGASPLALDYGSAVHVGLKALFNLYFKAAEAGDPDAALQKAFAALEKEFLEPEPPDPTGLRTMESAKGILTAVFEQWLPRYPWEDEAGEQKLSLTLPSGHIYSAILDRWGKMLGNGTILEFKTTAWPHLFTIDPNNQVVGQAAVLQANGVVNHLDVLFLLFYLHKEAKNGWITKKRKAKGEMPEPSSIIIPRPREVSQANIEEWVESTEAKIEIIERCCEKNYFPMEEEHCGDFGGCPFKAICTQTGKDRELIKQTAYKKIDWHKTKETAKKEKAATGNGPNK